MPLVHFERILLEWVLWVILFSLAFGGFAWRFPAQGQFWLDAVQKAKSLKEHRGSFGARQSQKQKIPSS